MAKHSFKNKDIERAFMAVFLSVIIFCIVFLLIGKFFEWKETKEAQDKRFQHEIKTLNLIKERQEERRNNSTEKSEEIVFKTSISSGKNYEDRRRPHNSTERTFNPTLETSSNGGKNKKIVLSMRIKYLDSKGKESEREIDIKSIKELDDGLGYVLAFCHLRYENRTFRADRITSGIDLETDKKIEDVFEYLKDIYKRSPQCKIDLLTVDPVVNSFYYCAKADGRVTKAEKEIILNAINKWKRTKYDLADITNIFNGMEKTTKYQFQKNVNESLESGEINKKVFIQVCQSILKTRKSPSDPVQKTLRYIQGRQI